MGQVSALSEISSVQIFLKHEGLSKTFNLHCWTTCWHRRVLFGSCHLIVKDILGRKELDKKIREKRISNRRCLWCLSQNSPSWKYFPEKEKKCVSCVYVYIYYSKFVFEFHESQRKCKRLEGERFWTMCISFNNDSPMVLCPCEKYVNFVLFSKFCESF